MRTRPPRPSPRPSPVRTGQDRAIRVNILLDDAVLRKRLELFQQRSTCGFLFSARPLPAAEVDLYVVGVRDIHLLPAQPPPEPSRGAARVQRVSAGPPGAPVIVYGPAEELRAAFLWGCADYLRLPFAPAELEARALRCLAARDPRYHFPWGAYGLEGLRLRLPDGDAVRLTALQARLVRILLDNRGQVVTRRALSVALWGRPRESGSRALDAQVCALRRKMRRNIIRAARGEGYSIDA